MVAIALQTRIVILRKRAPKMKPLLWPWFALVLLGAWHGLNPAMGWLFSVALGLQRKSRAAVFQALLPIALGHAISIGLFALAISVLSISVPIIYLRFGCGIILLALACYKLFRGRHPTWVGMQVNFWDLTGWSLVMATAHGAGLMIVPVFLGMNASFCGTLPQSVQPSIDPMNLIGMISVHTLSHLFMSGLLASIVFEFAGLAILRRSWINLDLIWSSTLLVTAVALFVVPM